MGAACGGQVCAIRAAQIGLKPVLIEKMRAAAGNTVFSAGVMVGINTKMQEGKIYPKILLKLFMKISQNPTDKALTQCVAKNATKTVEWLTDYVGVKFITGNMSI